MQMRKQSLAKSVSGVALARERRWHGWPARVVGQVMGVSRSRITAIEALARVRRTTAARYIAALHALSSVAPDREPDRVAGERVPGAAANDQSSHQREAAGVSSLPAASEVGRVSGEPRS
jgi:hypothetical protein